MTDDDVRVHLRAIAFGEAWVELNGRIVGAVTRTDEGLWWATLPVVSEVQGAELGHDIVGEHWLRRDAVADVVDTYRKREAAAMRRLALHEWPEEVSRSP